MPRIMRAASARPRSIAARIVLHGIGEADEDRLADQEMADVEFDDLGQRRDRLGGGVVEAVAGMDFEAEAPRQLRAVADALPFGLRRRHAARRQARRTRRRCGSRSPARRCAAAASICRGSAAMNSDTRMPAAAQSARRPARACSCWPATSSPPSVVRSSRRSGTRQAACGRGLERDARPSPSVAAISRLSGLAISALRRAMSSSRMWRRSSRRCAVMPSAPASIAILRRAHRIGMPPAARVADGRDVVDVDAEAKMRSRHACSRSCRRSRRDRRLRSVSRSAPITRSPARRRHHVLGPQLRDDRVEVLEVVDLEVDRHRR